MNETTLIGIDEIAGIIKISRREARDRLVKRPDFPRPKLTLSQKVRRWSTEDVMRWINERK